MKVYRTALKQALASRAAQRFINQRNDKEPHLKANNPLRPVIIWTDRSEKMTSAQRATVEHAVGLGAHSGKNNLGWNVLALACSFEEQAYVVVLQNVNGTYGFVYPNGQLDKHKTFIFRAIGDWTLDISPARPVGPKFAVERKEFILPDLSDRDPDPFESAPVRISGLYDRGHFRVD